MISFKALAKVIGDAFSNYTEEDLSVVVLNSRRPPKSKDVSGTVYVYDPSAPGIQVGWRFKMNSEVANQIPQWRMVRYIANAVKEAFNKDRRARNWAISTVEVKTPGCKHNGVFDPNTTEA